MDVETIMRRATRDFHSTAPLAPDSVRRTVPPGGGLQPNSFLHFGGSAACIDAPPFANGMITRATPLASARGLYASILRVDPVASIAVRRGAGGPIIALIAAPAQPPESGGSATRYQFGAGSTWVAASLLSSQAPADGFMGVKVASLELDAPGPPPANFPGDITLGAADSAALLITPAPRDPGTGFVNDGTGTTATLLPSISLLLAPSGISVLDIGDASFSTLGTNVTLSGGSTGAGWDAAAREIVIGYANMSPPTFVASGASVFGQASMIAGQYRLPVAEAASDALGAAATGGVPTVVVSAGLSWVFMGKPVRLGPAQVLAEQGSMGLRALVDQRAFAESFSMWTARGDGGTGRPTGLTFAAPRGAILAVVQSAQVEARLIFGAALQAAIDLPLTVAGSPILLDRLVASYSVTRTADNTTLNLLALPPPPQPGVPAPPPPIEVFAIENALLRTEGAASLLGAMTLSGTQAVSGLLVANMVLDDLLPILPDPYISNDPVLDRPRVGAGLMAEIGWSNPDDPGIAFALLPPNPPPPSHDPVSALIPWGQWEALLDVSGRADQLGVFMTPGAALIGQISGQTLQLPGQELGVFTVPHISWEAVIADTVLDRATGQPVAAPRQWLPPFSLDDGEPLRMTLRTKTPTTVEPLTTIAQFVGDYRTQATSNAVESLAVAMTLPFGLTASVTARQEPPEPSPPMPTLDLIGASFVGFAAGTQLRLTAPSPDSDAAALPGASRADGSYAQGMLDTTPGDVSTLWNGQFGGDLAGHQTGRFVPVKAIDFSGYGASLFSFWRDPTDGTGITQVRFDVVVGRTAFELVQAQSWILPQRIRVVDTKVFERDSDAYVVRHDSGWQPHGDGLFDYPDGVPETGGVLSLTRVRNVHPTGQPDVVAGGVTYRPVAFDADVVLDTDRGVLPADSATSLPSRGMIGYLRLTFSPTPPTLAEAVTLLNQVAAMGTAAAAGPVAAEAAVASTGFRFSLTAVEVQPMQQAGAVAANIAIAFSRRAGAAARRCMERHAAHAHRYGAETGQSAIAGAAGSPAGGQGDLARHGAGRTRVHRGGTGAPDAIRIRAIYWPAEAAARAPQAHRRRGVATAAAADAEARRCRRATRNSGTAAGHQPADQPVQPARHDADGRRVPDQSAGGGAGARPASDRAHSARAGCGRAGLRIATDSSGAGRSERSGEPPDPEPDPPHFGLDRGHRKALVDQHRPRGLQADRRRIRHARRPARGGDRHADGRRRTAARLRPGKSLLRPSPVAGDSGSARH
jgi:hypothetical protein